MAVEFTQDVIVKAGIADKVGDQRGRVEGIAGDPGGGGGCGYA